MAMVPLLAFPKVNRSATVYDRSIDRRCLFRDSDFAISRVCAGMREKTMTVKERQRMPSLATASVNRSDRIHGRKHGCFVEGVFDLLRIPHTFRICMSCRPSVSSGAAFSLKQARDGYANLLLQR